MRTKTEILDRLNALRSRRTDADKLFQPIEAKVERYFTGDSKLTHDVNYAIHQLAQDIITRRTIYEKQSLLPPFRVDYPLGYDDVRKLFDGGGSFEEIMSVRPENFDAAYSFEDLTQPPVSNSYLNSWAEKLGNAREDELAAIGDISSFCESTGFNCGLALLFESLGEIISSPGLNDVAKRIYNDGGYKEIIRAFGIDVYIPTTV